MSESKGDTQIINRNGYTIFPHERRNEVVALEDQLSGQLKDLIKYAESSPFAVVRRDGSEPLPPFLNRCDGGPFDLRQGDEAHVVVLFEGDCSVQVPRRLPWRLLRELYMLRLRVTPDTCYFKTEGLIAKDYPENGIMSVRCFARGLGGSGRNVSFDVDVHGGGQQSDKKSGPLMRNGNYYSQPQPQKARKRRNRKARQRQALTMAFPLLSDCAMAYCLALTDPFGEMPVLPCIPDMINIPSFKFKARVTGTFVIGTAGVGWVVMDPFAMMYNNGAASTSSTISTALLSTNASYTNTTYTWSLTGTALSTGVIGSNSGSMFTYAALSGDGLNPNNEIRLVGAGLRARYVGQPLYRAGRMVMYRDRSNTNITTGCNMLTFTKDQVYQTCPVNEDYQAVTFSHCKPITIGYQQVSLFNAGVNGGVNSFCMIAYIEAGAAASGQLMEFDAVAFFEVVGNDLGQPTPSDSDPLGYAAVNSALPTVNPTQASSLLSSVYDGAVTGIQTMSGQVGQLAGASASFLGQQAARAGMGMATYAIQSALRAGMHGRLNPQLL